jgi:hypothetical protein
MQSSIGTEKRRLMTFKQFVRGKGVHGKRLRLREADNQNEAVAELQYYVTALPRNLPQDEKLAQLSELADTITNIPNSDVFLFSLWIGG